MYLGRIMEIGSTRSILERPLHPYSKALISAIPVPDPHYHRERLELKGEIPSPIDLPSGCRFHPRCGKRRRPCSQEEPELKTIEEDHQVACHEI
jgi:oligopeptide/dipeptide ABC transporter ATP-binding protein